MRPVSIRAPEFNLDLAWPYGFIWGRAAVDPYPLVQIGKDRYGSVELQDLLIQLLTCVFNTSFTHGWSIYVYNIS